MNTTPASRSILRIHLHGIRPADPDLHDRALTLLGNVTPLVQALPPDAVYLDITGAQRYFATDTEGLAHLVRLRLAAHLGLQATIGAGPNPTIATMAAASSTLGTITVIAPEAVAAFLRPRPVAELPGAGPTIATTLAAYGIHHVGDLLQVPLLTLQRLLGKTTATTLAERARGSDPRPVLPTAPPKTSSCTHHFPHDELDPVAHRRALLALTEQLGLRLRTTRQATARLALTVTYADGTSTHRSRTLSEPTAHTPALTTSAYGLYARLGLQRARVRALTLRAEHLIDRERTVQQLVLDPEDDKRRRIEHAADQARSRFGPQAIRPGSLSRTR